MSRVGIPLSQLSSAFLVGCLAALRQPPGYRILDATGEAVVMQLDVPVEALSGEHDVGAEAEIILKIRVVE